MSRLDSTVVARRSSQVITAGALGFWAFLTGMFAVSLFVTGLGPQGTPAELVGAFPTTLVCGALLWTTVRCLTAQVAVDACGLTIRNVFSNRVVPWSAIGAFSIQQFGQGNNWRVVVLTRGTAADVPINSLHGSLDQAEASVNRLESLAPVGTVLSSHWKQPDPPSLWHRK